MRSIPKLAMVATFIIICTYTQFTEAQPRIEDRLVLNTTSIVIRTNPIKVPIGNQCCWRNASCCITKSGQEVGNIEGIKNIGDLGILFDLRNGSSIVVEEASIEIRNGDELVFSTKAKCLGCGKRLSSKTKGSYLLALDRSAVSAAQPHFVKGNKLVVIFKATGEGVPDTVYLVNKSEGKPVK
jgi:hypothetical protein